MIPCSTPIHDKADLSLNSTVKCSLRKSVGQGQAISLYKGRYRWAMQSTCISNATCIVGNNRKQHRNDPHGCYQDFTNKIASGVSLDICHILLTTGVGCICRTQGQSFLQATLPLGSHEGCVIWEESMGLVWLPRFRSWPGLILVSPVVNCDIKLERAVLMSKFVMTPNARGSWTF